MTFVNVGGLLVNVSPRGAWENLRKLEVGTGRNLTKPSLGACYAMLWSGAAPENSGENSGAG